MIDLKIGNIQINEEGNVVLEDGVELNMRKEEYLCLKFLQTQVLEVLLVVDKFCEEHNLTYYLGEGTLLGAIRHQGFIPWDDDIDILMPRDDYEKFIALAQEGLPEGYQLDSIETNPNHWTILAQVQMTKPVPYLKKRMEGIALNNGPAIDIFPVDFVPSDKSRKLAIRSAKIKLLRRTMWIKSGVHKRDWYKTLYRRLKYYYPLKTFGLFQSLESMAKRSAKMMVKTNNNPDSVYATVFSSLYGINRETFKKEYLGKPIRVPFEGHLLPVPKEYEKILNLVYGDFMLMPEVRKRKTKHFYIFEPDSVSKIEDKEILEFVDYVKKIKAETENQLQKG